jgi:hypothetical protein
MLLLLVGLCAFAWATYCVVTRKAHYAWAPPGGYDRDANPIGFWAPTGLLYLCGLYIIMLGLGFVR